LASAVAAVAEDVVRDVAVALGADVPSQVEPGVSVGRGAGELVEPVAALPPHAFLVLPQPFGLSTAEVYREADRQGLPRADLDEPARALGDALRRGGALVANDLQPAALALRPEIEQALDEARYAGAEHAIVSGSGPTALGVFWGRDAEARARMGAVALAGRYPGATAAVPVDASFGAVTPA
jgi:4-diphosphocytidyl-2-C-methyl-D-erythritol kinase